MAAGRRRDLGALFERVGAAGAASVEPPRRLEQFGVTVLGRVTPAWEPFMAFQAQRARAHLGEGLRLLDSLDRRSALCVATFAGLYRGQLDRMEANGFDVFGPSCRLSTAAKLAVVARGLVR